MQDFFSENRNDVVMVVVDKISMVIIHLVGTVSVDLWAVVACGVSLQNLQLCRQGVDLAWQRGGAAAR